MMKKSKILTLMLTGYFLFAFSRDAFAMHISEGILPLKWAALWYLVAIPFLIKGVFEIKKKTKEAPFLKPLLGLMGALIFVLSCLPVPVPTAGTCSHPAGTGISSLLIGPVLSTFVSSIALLIQALFLAHGGITTLGADIVSMGLVGSFSAFFVFKALRKFNASLFVCGFAAGLMADWATYTMTSFELALGLHGSEHFGTRFMSILIAFIPTQLPLGILEGCFTGGMLVFVANRRPDILARLNISFKPEMKKSMAAVKKFTLFIIIYSVFSLTPLHAEEEGKWVGVDVSVVEKVASEQGREAWAPFINTDQGDLLLFVFLLAGVIGGFFMGVYYKKIFVDKEGMVDVNKLTQ